MNRIVEVCRRVEGHGNVNILYKEDKIIDTEFEIKAFRGFENILRKKQLMDIPKIASRICGLCHASQTIASCKAIEDLFDLSPNEQIIFHRKLLLTGELIKSHSMHLFFQALPDLLSIFEITENPPNPQRLIGFNSELTNNYYELIKIGNDIDELLGGRAVHTITPLPGGKIPIFSQKNINLVKKYLQKARLNVKQILIKYVDLFAEKLPPKEFTYPTPTCLALHNHGNYNRYNGILGLKSENKKPINFYEKNYSTYFDKDPELRGITFSRGKNILVGPIARFNLIDEYRLPEISSLMDQFDPTWRSNSLFSNILKLIEMRIEIEDAIEIMESIEIDIKPDISDLNFNIKNNEGYGVVEAPRGTLLHHYKLDEEHKVDKIKLFIATEINIPIINTMITEYSQQLYEKYGDINLIKRKVQNIIRSFDPCISCATH
ncbi:MAG: putative Hydrogen dehydrogenase [Promethearchaeota archaeon]|nr:MAG: putative Hydrogen dehydrogenase [Candidatus Lokiarchaeota archaeon]